MDAEGDNRAPVAILRDMLHAVGRIEGSSVLKAVLFAIVAHANERGESWPSMRKVAAYAGVSRRTAQGAVVALESRGILRLDRTNGGPKNTNIFHLSLDDNGAPEAPLDEAQGRSTSAQPPETRAHTVRHCAHNGAGHAPLEPETAHVVRRSPPNNSAPDAPLDAQRCMTSAVGVANGASGAPNGARPAQEPTKNQKKEREGARALRFDEFWQAWPPHRRKADRKKCRAIWDRQDLDAKADEILVSLEAWKRSADWAKEDGNFIPAPMTWLNQERWEAATPKRARGRSALDYAKSAANRAGGSN